MSARSLTRPQQAALDIVRRDGVLHCYNGVTITTAQALHSRGLAVLELYPPSRTVSRRGRTRYTRQWALKKTDQETRSS